MNANDAALAALERVRRQLQHLKDREVKEIASPERKDLVANAAMSLSLMADELRDETGYPHWVPPEDRVYKYHTHQEDY